MFAGSDRNKITYPREDWCSLQPLHFLALCKREMQIAGFKNPACVLKMLTLAEKDCFIYFNKMHLFTMNLDYLSTSVCQHESVLSWHDYI